MEEDLEDAILRAIDKARKEPRSRGASLTVTKLEEALFWLREGRMEDSVVGEAPKPRFGQIFKGVDGRWKFSDTNEPLTAEEHKLYNVTT